MKGVGRLRALAATLVLVLALLGTLSLPAFADSRGPLQLGFGGNNSVNLFNTQSNSTLVAASTDIELDTGSTVANQNVALVQASCSTCRTVGVAIQIVVVQGTPSNYTPQNGAVAVNTACTACQTFAYANQVVIQTTSTVSPAAARYLDQAEAIASQVDAAAHSGETFEQMSAQLDSLTQQLANLVKQALRAPTPPREDVRRAEREGA